MRTITITLSDELEAELRRIADADSVNGATAFDKVVNDALREYVEQHARGTAKSAPHPDVMMGLFTPIQELDELGEPDVSVDHDKYLADAFFQRRRDRARE